MSTHLVLKPAAASVLLLLALAGASVPAVAETVTFTDGVFAPRDWDLDVYYSMGNGGIITARQVLTGGNPLEYREVTDSVNAAPPYSIIAAFHRYVPGTYNPAVQGPITAIDYAEDAIMISGGGDGEGSAPALRQNGIIYVGPIFGTPERRWTHHSYPGLRDVDFRDWLGSAERHPDFSAGGAPIEVGFFRGNSTYGGGYTIVGGIDNWTLTINPQPTPVEPSTWGRVKALYSTRPGD